MTKLLRFPPARGGGSLVGVRRKSAGWNGVGASGNIGLLPRRGAAQEGPGQRHGSLIAGPVTRSDRAAGPNLPRYFRFSQCVEQWKELEVKT